MIGTVCFIYWYKPCWKQDFKKQIAGETPPPRCWSITCVLGIVRALKGLNRWKPTGWPIRWRRLRSQPHSVLQQEGTENMWGLLWGCGLNPSPENRGTTMKLIFPSQSAKHVSLVLPPHTYTCTCICLCVNTNKMLITRRLSALPAERADYLLDNYKSCHLKYCWNMLVPFNKEQGTKNVKIRMKRQFHALPQGWLLTLNCSLSYEVTRSCLPGIPCSA